MGKGPCAAGSSASGTVLQITRMTLEHKPRGPSFPKKNSRLAWAELELEEDSEKRSRLRDAVHHLLRKELVKKGSKLWTRTGLALLARVYRRRLPETFCRRGQRRHQPTNHDLPAH